MYISLLVLFMQAYYFIGGQLVNINSTKMKIKSVPSLTGAIFIEISNTKSPPSESFKINCTYKCVFQVTESSTAVSSPGDQLSKRCVMLLKTALRADVWPNAELKLAWFAKLLLTVENHQPNFANICTALELLSFLLTILVSFL